VALKRPAERGRGLALLRRPSLGEPFGQTAVEHRDVVVPHGAEHPPHPAGAEQAGGVVGHNPVGAGNAEPADGVGEDRGRRQHVRQIARLLGDGVDIEEHRAGDVAFEKLGPPVAAGGRHVPRRVDHADARRVQVRGQPVGRDQRLRILVGCH
jgi:hypothetical protein